MNTNIEMYRGDSRDQGFVVKSAGESINYSGAKVTFTMKEQEDDASPTLELKNEAAGGSEEEIEMETSRFIVHFKPEDTEGLAANRFYHYDIQYEKDTKVLTIVKGKLNLKKDITI